VEDFERKVGEFAYLCSMKLAWQHTAVLLLTLCILLSSVGVALSEQLCSMTGLKQVTAIPRQDNCCEEPTAANKDESGCCKAHVSYEKLDPVSTVKLSDLHLPVLFSAVIKPVAAFNPALFLTDTRLYTYTDNSPPLYGRSLLHKKQVLLI